MVYSSTLVSRGKGTAIVVATGMDTEIGRIAGMARQVKEPRTPLQNMMDELSKALVWFALGFSVLVPLVGVFFAHQPPKQMLLTGLSLAFATIPEELPIIITMVLSLGAFRLSKKHAIAKRLNAVESLGSVTVIATDKTGTLTENRMEVARFEPEGSQDSPAGNRRACATTQSRTGLDFAGDPVDTALLRAAQKAGLDVWSRNDKTTRCSTNLPLITTRKRMSVVYQKDGQLVGGGERRARINPRTVHTADEGETVEALTAASAAGHPGACGQTGSRWAAGDGRCRTLPA